MAEEIEVTCPNCGGIFIIEIDDADDMVICDECEWEFYVD